MSSIPRLEIIKDPEFFWVRWSKNSQWTPGMLYEEHWYDFEWIEQFLGKEPFEIGPKLNAPL